MPRPDGLSSRGRDVGASDRRDRRRGAHDLAARCRTRPRASRDSTGSWFWDDGSLTVRSVDTNTDGQRYRVTRLEVEPTPAAAPRRRPRPAGGPRAVPRTARGAAGRSSPTPRHPSRGRGVAVRRGGRDPGVPARRRLRLLDRGARRGGLRRRRVRRHRAVPRDEGRLLRALRLDDGGARARGRHPGAHLDRLHAGLADGRARRRRAARRGRLARPALVARALLRGRRLGAVRADAGSRHRCPTTRAPARARSRARRCRAPRPSTPGASGRPELDPDRGLAGSERRRVRGRRPAGGSAAARRAARRGAPAAPARPRSARASGSRGFGAVRRGERPADAAWDELVATARDLGAGGGDAETAARVRGPDRRRETRSRTTRRRARRSLRLRDAVERERYGPAGASAGPGLAEDLGAGA